MSKKFSFYKIKLDYYLFISKYDSKVPQASGAKKNRPFIGVVLTIHNKNYYAL